MPFGSQPIATQTVDTTAAEFGVACESCHGPADEHVRLNANPQRRYALHLTKSADASIVDPARRVRVAFGGRIAKFPERVALSADLDPRRSAQPRRC